MRRSLRTTSLSGLLISGWLEVVLGNLHQPGKGTAVAHGQVSQHLAVDLHPGLAKAVHQFVVGQPRLPRGGVDPRDPQLPHLALAAAAVAPCRLGARIMNMFLPSRSGCRSTTANVRASSATLLRILRPMS